MCQNREERIEYFPALYPNERIDDLQIKGYKIIQNREKFCFGMDAVLLSNYAKVKKGSRVIDLCSGTGIVPILLEAKYGLDHIAGLEYQKDCVDMAIRSIRMNGLSDKIRMIEGDIKEVRNMFPHGSYDYVTCNPPYMTENHGLTNHNYSKAIARHEILCSLDDVVQAARWLLEEMGHFVMVHRPFRLAEIFYCLKENKLEPKRMRLVYPYVDKEPNMVLIEAVKGGKQRITVDPPLIVYKKDGSYTDEIYEEYGGLI
ncbi:MAG: tRNA1(Val) (adenine(37)-N6)-methyltransferase [Clostridiales bacterium]|nr:tRNA1(Val) (adenine(37)-N6)-methyltransferase [Clostridiales bacterium]